MSDEEKEAIRRALRHIFEENIYPYRAVGESVAREMQREKEERDWWNQFLPGRSGPTATAHVDPPGRTELRITYAPDADGDPRAGEIVWTWVPVDAARDGAYRPVLIVGRQEPDRFYAIRLSPSSHEGSHRFLAIGAGPRDSRGRLSWAETDQILSVHAGGMRREGFIMDRHHFTRIADDLYGRYGWAMDD